MSNVPDHVRRTILEAAPPAALTSTGPDEFRDALIALTGLTPAQVDAALVNDETLSDVQRVIRKSELDGSAVAIEALHVELALVRRIREVAHEVDAFEAVELLKPLQRIRESAERIRLAEKETTEHKLIIDISRLPGAAQALQAGVVDVVPRNRERVEVFDAPEPRFGSSEQALEPLATQQPPSTEPELRIVLDTTKFGGMR